MILTDTLNTRDHCSLAKIGFLGLPEVTNHEIIILFRLILRVCSFLSILYFCTVMGSDMDHICCTVLGHECRVGTDPGKAKN
jgi:hypothetical protein